VFARSNCFVVLVALTTALALGACGNNNFDTSGAWFSKPLDFSGSKGGYTYSNLSDSAKLERPITANDMVDAGGACPAVATPASPPQAQAAAVSTDVASLISGGVAIGMSECEVVGHLGGPTALNFGKTPNGDRTLVLTYNSGPRPGVYRFAAGRLAEMDRVEVPPPPPEPQKKLAKKKPVKPKDAALPADKS
jgi:hypothetical protein